MSIAMECPGIVLLPPVAAVGVSDFIVTLSGGPFSSPVVFAGSAAVDIGDYVGLFVRQKCFVVTNPAAPDWRVWIRPDADGSGNRILSPAPGSRDEVIVEHGRSTHGTPTNAGAYTTTITKGGINVTGSPFSIPKQWWYSRWWYESAPRAVVRMPATAIASGLLPPFGAAGMFGLTKLMTTATSGGPFTTPTDPTLGAYAAVLEGPGANSQIGHLTERAADYAVFQGAESLASIRIECQWIGNWSMHTRDDTTLAPVDARGGHLGYIGDGGTLNECPSSADVDFVSCRNSDALSHWYPIAYMGAVLFDDPKMIEELQFGANQAVLINLFHRSANSLWGMVYPGQTRGFAWGLRELMRAAAITPASVPQWLRPKSYWQSCVGDCKTFALNYVTNTAKVHSIFRIWTQVNFAESWMQMFLLAVVGYGYDLGFTDWHDGTANDIYAWAVDYLIQLTKDRAGGLGWRREYPVPFIHHPLLGETGGAASVLLYCGGPDSSISVAAADAETANSWDDHWSHAVTGYAAGENVAGSGSWRDIGAGPGGLGLVTATLDGTTIVEDLEHSDEFFYELRAALSMAVTRNVTGASTAYAWLQNQFATTLLPHYGGANATRNGSGPYARWSIDPRTLTLLLAGMPAGSWKRVAGSALATVAYSGGGFPPLSGPISNIISDWSGAAFDPVNRVLYVWGGGHVTATGYAGNEIYAFDLPSLTWREVDQPDTGFTAAQYDSSTDLLPNNQPIPRHTYDHNAFLPSQGLFFSCHGNTGLTWTLNPATQNPSAAGVWAQVDPLPSSNIGGSGLLPGGICAYDSASGHVFFAGSDLFGLDEFNPSAAPGTQWTINQPAGFDQLPINQMTGAISPGAAFVATGNGHTVSISIAGATKGAQTSLTTTGDKTVENANGPAFAFHSPSGKYVGWATDAVDNRTLRIFDPATNIWTAHSATGDIPANAQANGTYGRWQYDAIDNCFVLVNDTGQDTLIYKPDF